MIKRDRMPLHKILSFNLLLIVVILLLLLSTANSESIINANVIDLVKIIEEEANDINNLHTVAIRKVDLLCTMSKERAYALIVAKEYIDKDEKYNWYKLSEKGYTNNALTFESNDESNEESNDDHEKNINYNEEDNNDNDRNDRRRRRYKDDGNVNIAYVPGWFLIVTCAIGLIALITLSLLLRILLFSICFTVQLHSVEGIVIFNGDILQQMENNPSGYMIVPETNYNAQASGSDADRDAEYNNNVEQHTCNRDYIMENVHRSMAQFSRESNAYLPRHSNVRDAQLATLQSVTVSRNVIRDDDDDDDNVSEDVISTFLESPNELSAHFRNASTNVFLRSVTEEEEEEEDNNKNNNVDRHSCNSYTRTRNSNTVNVCNHSAEPSHWRRSRLRYGNVLVASQENVNSREVDRAASVQVNNNTVPTAAAAAAVVNLTSLSSSNVLISSHEPYGESYIVPMYNTPAILPSLPVPRTSLIFEVPPISEALRIHINPREWFPFIFRRRNANHIRRHRQRERERLRELELQRQQTPHHINQDRIRVLQEQQQQQQEQEEEVLQISHLVPEREQLQLEQAQQIDEIHTIDNYTPEVNRSLVSTITSTVPLPLSIPSLHINASSSPSTSSHAHSVPVLLPSNTYNDTHRTTGSTVVNINDNSNSATVHYNNNNSNNNNNNNNNSNTENEYIHNHASQHSNESSYTSDGDALLRSRTIYNGPINHEWPTTLPPFEMNFPSAMEVPTQMKQYIKPEKARKRAIHKKKKFRYKFAKFNGEYDGQLFSM